MMQNKYDHLFNPFNVIPHIFMRIYYFFPHFYHHAHTERLLVRGKTQFCAIPKHQFLGINFQRNYLVWSNGIASMIQQHHYENVKFHRGNILGRLNVCVFVYVHVYTYIYTHTHTHTCARMKI